MRKDGLLLRLWQIIDYQQLAYRHNTKHYRSSTRCVPTVSLTFIFRSVAVNPRRQHPILLLKEFRELLGRQAYAVGHLGYRKPTAGQQLTAAAQAYLAYELQRRLPRKGCQLLVQRAAAHQHQPAEILYGELEVAQMLLNYPCSRATNSASAPRAPPNDG